jgi:hypothetical protein
MVRDRVVADDWLVSIDGNRYSVPWRLIGKTVQVVRGRWAVAHPPSRRGGGRAPGAGRTPPTERTPEHGPGARNAAQQPAGDSRKVNKALRHAAALAPLPNVESA